MRAAGDLAGVSDSLIAHTETGRVNPPQGAALERLLKVYGGIKEKSFYERVRTFERKLTSREELAELIKRATEKQAQMILQIVKGVMG